MACSLDEVKTRPGDLFAQPLTETSGRHTILRASQDEGWRRDLGHLLPRIEPITGQEIGVEHLGTVLSQIEGWMEAKGYGTLADFRGKMSRARSADPWIYTRSQYVKLLLQTGEKLIKQIT